MMGPMTETERSAYTDPDGVLRCGKFHELVTGVDTEATDTMAIGRQTHTSGLDINQPCGHARRWARTT